MQVKWAAITPLALEEREAGRNEPLALKGSDVAWPSRIDDCVADTVLAAHTTWDKQQICLEVGGQRSERVFKSESSPEESKISSQRI